MSTIWKRNGDKNGNKTAKKREIKWKKKDGKMVTNWR